MIRTMDFLRAPEGDVLDSGAPPRVEPVRIKKITCEFCDCELGTSGEYKKLSDKAKMFREAEDTIETLRENVVRLEAEITALKAARPATAPAQSGERRSGIAL